MMIDGTEYYPVEGTEEQLADLKAKSDDWWDSQELAEYAANTLGIEPPHRLPGGNLPAISGLWISEQSQIVLIWALHEEEEHDPDDGLTDEATGWEGSTPADDDQPATAEVFQHPLKGEFDAASARWERPLKDDGEPSVFEIGHADNGLVAMRRHDEPDTILIYTPEEWQAFLEGKDDGEFDLPGSTS
ncbi:hypothetical protein [Salininema proteolyticum]|uniref:DUF397 domain-containing protein n=1 Tax=Salininema proteolyticum TaxID=1607685 RepID=A0ABV8U098_9ACTN